MAEIKGRFISLAAGLMSLYKEQLAEADKQLFEETGQHWNELDPDGWYDISHYNRFISTYVESSVTGEMAMLTLGRNIYPTIKRTVGFPSGLKTPVDYIEFESVGYQENVRGPEVRPRKFVKKEEGYVVVQTRMTEQDCKLLEGVYLGILELAGVVSGEVLQKKCLKRGDSMCEFHITW